MESQLMRRLKQTPSPGNLSPIAPISVVTIDDGVYEPIDETFNVTLSSVTINSPTPVSIITTKLVGIGTIQDNNGTPTITISNETVTEEGTANFTVALSCAAQQHININLDTRHDSACTTRAYTD